MKLMENALKGVKIWQKTPHRVRQMKYRRGWHRWGFEGKSPHTRKRKYKKK